MTVELRKAWLATVAWFALNAFGFASFVVRMPEIKKAFDLSNSTLGITLFIASLGALGAIKLGGRWAAKFGSSPVMVYSAFASAFLFPLLGSLINWFIFAGTLFTLFLTLSVMDIAMNAQAVTIEQKSGKMIMGRMHAMWSVGGIVGGLTGGIFFAQSISLFAHSIVVSGLMALLALGLKGLLLSGDTDRHEPEDSENQKVKSPGIFYLLGFIGLSAAIMEGSAADWGAVLVADEYGAAGFAISLPYIVFQSGMVLGRMNGDAAAAKFGRTNLLAASGTFAGVGLATGLILGGIPATILAWFCLGLGASVVIPMAFSMAGAIATNDYPHQIAPAQAVAKVSGIAYAAFFIGPPTIGLIADLTSLRIAMGIPALLAIGVVVGSRFIRV
jgi:MFS family permease